MPKKTKQEIVKVEPKAKEEKSVLKTVLMEQSKADQLTKYPYSINISVEDEIQEIKEIENHIESVKCKRSEYCLEDIWQEDRDLYNGVLEYKDFPWENCSALHIHITSMAVDVFKVKAKEQMFTYPVMVLQPLPGQLGKNIFKDVADKQEYLEYITREEMELEYREDPILQDAILLGTGFGKLHYLRKIDYDSSSLEYYGVSPQEITRFKDDFEDQKSTKEYKKYLKDLTDGIPITVPIFDDIIMYDNPKLNYVKLEDLYLDPDIPEIENHNIISEKMELTWKQISNFVRMKYFKASIKEKIKSQYPDDYWKKIYTVYETVKYFDYKKNDNPKKVIITYIEEIKKIARAILFPYVHQEFYYIPFYIKKRPDSIYGEGFGQKLKYTNKSVNSLWNLTIDSGTLRNAPMLKAVADSFDPTIKKMGPAFILWVKKDINSVQPLQMQGQQVELGNYIDRMIRFAEWQTGVTAYMTGRESPQDPNAPASKAFMLLKESNLRITDCVKQLHKANKMIYKQVDSLKYQFTKGNVVQYLTKRGEVYEGNEINKRVLGIKVQYIPHLSDVSVNREFVREENMKFATYLASNPLIMSNPEALRTITEIVIQDRGGVWQKNLDRLLPKQIQNKPALEQPTPDLRKPGGGLLNIPEVSGIPPTGVIQNV